MRIFSLSSMPFPNDWNAAFSYIFGSWCYTTNVRRMYVVVHCWIDGVIASYPCYSIRAESRGFPPGTNIHETDIYVFTVFGGGMRIYISICVYISASDGFQQFRDTSSTYFGVKWLSVGISQIYLKKICYT